MPQERKSDTLGKMYVTLKSFFVTEDGVALPRAEYSKMTAKSLRDKYSEKLLEGKFFDYAEAKNNGRLVPRRSVSTDNVVKDNYEEVCLVNETEDKVITALRLCMLAVGLASTVVTGANLQKGLSLYLSPPVAAVFAVSMALFLTGSFEAFIVFKRKRMHGLASVIVACFLVTITYSVSVEMEVFYKGFEKNEGSFKESVKAEDGGAIATKKLLKSYADDIAVAEENYRRAVAEYDRYYALPDKVSWGVTTRETKATQASEQLRELRSKERELLSNVPSAVVVDENRSNRSSFIQFVADTFGVDGRKLRFARDMLPALFIDFISPISVSVAMFLGGTNGKGKRKGKAKDEDGVLEDFGNGDAQKRSDFGARVRSLFSGARRGSCDKREVRS